MDDDDRDKIDAKLTPGESLLNPEAMTIEYFGTRFPTPEENAEMMRRLSEQLGDDDAPDL